MSRRAGPDPSAPPDARVHGLNDQLAVALLVVLAATAIAFGSYGATFWTISAAAVGLIATWYWGRLALLDSAPRVRLVQFWPEAALFTAFCLVLVAQVLPLSLPFDGGFSGPDGTQYRAATLSFAPDDTLLMLMRQVGYALFWFLFVQAGRNTRRARVILVTIFGMIVAHAGYSLISLTQLGDTVLGFPKTSYLGFATGTFINRNSFATYLASGMATGTALLLGSFVVKRERLIWQEWAERAALLVGIGFIVGALLATGSRMGLVAGIGGVALVTLVCAIVRPARIVFVVAGLLIVAGGLVMLGYSGSLIDRLLGLIGSSDGRWPVYATMLEMIAERPWLGYGGGSFATVFPVFQRPPVDGGFIWELGHSTYLSLWLELGIIAGSLPTLIVVLLAGRILVALRDPKTLVTGLAALGTIGAFAIHATVDFSLEIQADTYLFVAMLALGASGHAATRERVG